MNKKLIITPLLFFLLIAQTTNLRLHNYYALENADVVSKSQSIKQMNKCKDQCLTMGKYFPFKFKYHRYILREKVGKNKYFQGICQFAVAGTEKWYGWADLKVFITQTNTQTDMSQVERWSNFRDKCEDTTLKLDNKTLTSMGFQRVHSNFQYYDNGTFVNLQPFNDLDDLMGQVGGLIK